MCRTYIRLEHHAVDHYPLRDTSFDVTLSPGLFLCAVCRLASNCRGIPPFLAKSKQFCRFLVVIEKRRKKLLRRPKKVTVVIRVPGTRATRNPEITRYFERRWCTNPIIPFFCSYHNINIVSSYITTITQGLPRYGGILTDKCMSCHYNVAISYYCTYSLTFGLKGSLLGKFLISVITKQSLAPLVTTPYLVFTPFRTFYTHGQHTTYIHHTYIHTKKKKKGSLPHIFACCPHAARFPRITPHLAVSCPVRLDFLD